MENIRSFKFVTALEEVIRECINNGTGYIDIEEETKFKLQAVWESCEDGYDIVMVYISKEGVIKLCIPITETKTKE